MKKGKTVRAAELRPEYDLRSLQVRRLGPARKSFGGSVVRLEPDVAAMFPSTESVNEALRFLIRVTKDNKPALQATKGLQRPTVEEKALAQKQLAAIKQWAGTNLGSGFTGRDHDTILYGSGQ